METILLPSGVIASIFWVFWMVTYPSQILDALLFRERDTAVDVAACVGTWVFFLGFVGTITFACSRLA